MNFRNKIKKKIRMAVRRHSEQPGSGNIARTEIQNVITPTSLEVGISLLEA
jgi:hypothetical protein